MMQFYTPEQIANKLALPYIPTHITSIKPPSGTKIRTGTVNPNFKRSGGGQQFEFIDNVPTKGWGNGTAIK